MNKNLALLLCVSIPSFMINLDANIVAVSLTSIAHILRADLAETEWVISAYTLAFAAFLMPAGAIADRFGRKRTLLLGLSIFTAASWLCGAASSPAMLDISRALQGIGAAMQLSAALAILSHGFQGRARAKAFAFWGSVIGMAIMLGPVAGGVITQALGWQWSFYVNIPIGLVMIAMTTRYVAESFDPGTVKLDLLGALTFSGFLGFLTWALICGNRDGWTSRSVLIKLSIATVLVIAFLIAELKQARPMVDLSLFVRRTYLGANTAGVAFAATFLSMLTYLPIFFQNGLGFTPLDAGLLMLPLAVPLFVMPRLVSRLLDHRASGRLLVTTGLLLVGVGLTGTSVMVEKLSYVATAFPMFVASIGAGMLNGQTAKVGMTVIPIERAGMASGIAGTMRFSGIVIGFAALGAVMFQRVSQSVGRAVPSADAQSLNAIAHSVANGNLNLATALIEAHHGSPGIAQLSLSQGFAGIALAAGLLALVAAGVSWTLISPIDTAPHSLGVVQSPDVSND